MFVDNTSASFSPLVTIVTVTYNAASGIEDTIKSVVNQPVKNFEYIVIDGNSTDGTQEIVEKYIDKIDVWLSEPDHGIPDALNKSVKLAKGKYLLFILAGDKLINLPYEHLDARKCRYCLFSG